MASYLPPFVQDDDVFDEECEDDIIPRKEWSQIRSARTKEGYREGSTAGQDLAVQDGFNSGFKECITQAFEIAKLKGQISALLGYHISQGGKFLSKEAESGLQRLLMEVSDIQEPGVKPGRDASYAKYSLVQGDDDASKVTQIQDLVEELSIFQTDRVDLGDRPTSPVKKTGTKHKQINIERNVPVETLDFSDFRPDDGTYLEGKEGKDKHGLSDVWDTEKTRGTPCVIHNSNKNIPWEMSGLEGDSCLPVKEIGQGEQTLDGQCSLLTADHIRRFQSLNRKYEKLIASQDMQYLLR